MYDGATAAAEAVADGRGPRPAARACSWRAPCTRTTRGVAATRIARGARRTRSRRWPHEGGLTDHDALRAALGDDVGVPAPAAAELLRLPGGRCAALAEAVHAAGALAVVAADPTRSALLEAPGALRRRHRAWARGRRSATARPSAAPRSASSPRTRGAASAACRAASSARRPTSTAAAASCSRCRRASSTSAARRRPRTSARTRRSCALAGDRATCRTSGPAASPSSAASAWRGASYARQRLADVGVELRRSPAADLQRVRGAGRAGRRARRRARLPRARRPRRASRSAATTRSCDDCLLVAVTEQRTKRDIDRLAFVLSEVVG